MKEFPRCHSVCVCVCVCVDGVCVHGVTCVVRDKHRNPVYCTDLTDDGIRTGLSLVHSGESNISTNIRT